MRRSKWTVEYIRGDLAVEYRRELVPGYCINVSAVGKKGFPFPEKPEQVRGWYSFVWTPGVNSVGSGPLCKTVEKCMANGEARAVKILSLATQRLVSVNKELRAGRRESRSSGGTE